MKGMDSRTETPIAGGLRMFVDTYHLKASKGVDGLILHPGARASLLSVKCEGDEIVVKHTYYLKSKETPSA